MPVFEQPSSNMHLLFSKCWYDQISNFSYNLYFPTIFQHFHLTFVINTLALCALYCSLSKEKSKTNNKSVVQTYTAADNPHLTVCPYGYIDW